MSEWQIILAEKNMNLGIWDRAVYGRDTCHSFVALINPHGQVVSEIHGTTYHPKSNKMGYKGQAPHTFLKSIASSVGLSEAFRNAVVSRGIDQNWPRLKAFITDGPWRMNDIDAEHKHTVLSGTREDVLTEWLDACEIAEEFNKLDEYYMPVCARTGGRNCNSIAALMLHAMDVDFPEEHFIHAAPGFRNFLADQHDTLKSFDTRKVRHPNSLYPDLLRMTKGPTMLFHVADKSHQIVL